MSPSATAIEIEKNGMPRFAFSEPSIGSTTTVQRPLAFDADLLADDAHVLAAEALEDHALGGRVDRRRLVAALARADDGLAVGAQRQLVEHARDVVPCVAAERVPVGHTGWKSRPDVSFGKKNVDFCGIVSPACAKRDTCSTVTGWSRNAAAASPRSTAATASSAYAV